MSTDTVEVEGDSLQEALSKAAALLGCERDAVDFEYDREHLAAGASTVKIYARKMDEAQLAEARAKRAAEAARSSARSDRGPRPPRDDRGPPRDDRGPPRDDRGPRPPRDDRRGPPRGDDRRGPPRSDDRRGPPRGDRPRPEKDPVRDEALRERARDVARRVLGGEGPLSLDDLNSYERHLVHTVIAETGGLTSQSIGEGLRKNVQIAVAAS